MNKENELILRALSFLLHNHGNWVNPPKELTDRISELLNPTKDDFKEIKETLKDA